MKETINVKSNGLRNELKEIRKGIDKLTEVLLLRQTNKQNENNNYNCTCGNSRKLRESKHDDD